MNQAAENSKRKTDNWQYRDWKRHARVIAHLHRRQATIQEMSDAIGESVYAVSKCVWGIPGRTVDRIEEKIAAFLGVSRAELFEKQKVA